MDIFYFVRYFTKRAIKGQRMTEIFKLRYKYNRNCLLDDNMTMAN